MEEQSLPPFSQDYDWEMVIQNREIPIFHFPGMESLFSRAEFPNSQECCSFPSQALLVEGEGEAEIFPWWHSAITPNNFYFFFFHFHFQSLHFVKWFMVEEAIVYLRFNSLGGHKALFFLIILLFQEYLCVIYCSEFSFCFSTQQKLHRWNPDASQTKLNGKK